MMEAILAALSYWVVWCLDNITGTQALSRPLVLGTVTGLFCGDMKTGIIMGATLEAIYLGAVGVGGVVPSSNYGIHRLCRTDRHRHGGWTCNCRRSGNINEFV